MLTEPLPTSLDVRKAAARGAVLKGVLQPADMARAREILASDNGRIEVQLAFSRDEENRTVIALSLTVDVEVTCQRCLEALPIQVHASNQLAVVGSDDRARDLPAQLDPLVVEGDNCGLWTLVEDELMLALPIVSYHDTDDCKRILDEYTAPPPDAAGQRENNPFKVLEQLKSSGNNPDI